MRNTLILITLALFLAGCASSVENTANSSNANSAQNANTEQAIVPKNAETGESVSIPGVTGPPDNSNVKINAETYDTSKAVEGKPASEDSTFSTRLTDVAIETRTFKSHPIIAKVERTTDVKGRTIKVFLRSGKVIELPGDKIGNLQAASSAQIMAAAGIESAAPAMTPKPKSADPKYSKQP